MIRTFKYFSIVAGGTPQPLIGTKLSAAVQVSDSPVSLPVGDSSMFTVGDYAVVDVAAVEERHMVIAVPDGTHVTVKRIIFAHAANAYVRLGRMSNSAYVQSKDGNTGPLYIGTSSGLVAATGIGVIAKLVQVAAGVQPSEWSQALGGPISGIDVSQYWIDGTTNDSYLPSIITI